MRCAAAHRVAASSAPFQLSAARSRDHLLPAMCRRSTFGVELKQARCQTVLAEQATCASRQLSGEARVPARECKNRHGIVRSWLGTGVPPNVAPSLREELAADVRRP